MGRLIEPKEKERLINEIKLLIAQGLHQIEIAKQLGLSLSTVRRYMWVPTEATPAIEGLKAGAFTKPERVKQKRKPYTKRQPKLVEIESAPSNQDLKLKVVYELMRFLNEK